MLFSYTCLVIELNVQEWKFANISRKGPVINWTCPWCILPLPKDSLDRLQPPCDPECKISGDGWMDGWMDFKKVRQDLRYLNSVRKIRILRLFNVSFKKQTCPRSTPLWAKDSWDAIQLLGTKRRMSSDWELLDGWMDWKNSFVTRFTIT